VKSDSYMTCGDKQEDGSAKGVFDFVKDLF